MLGGDRKAVRQQLVMAGLCAGSVSAREKESGRYGSAQHVWDQWRQLQQPWCHSYIGAGSSQETGDAHDSCRKTALWLSASTCACPAAAEDHEPAPPPKTASRMQPTLSMSNEGRCFLYGSI